MTRFFWWGVQLGMSCKQCTAWSRVKRSQLDHAMFLVLDHHPTSFAVHACCPIVGAEALTCPVFEHCRKYSLIWDHGQQCNLHHLGQWQNLPRMGKAM